MKLVDLLPAVLCFGCGTSRVNAVLDSAGPADLPTSDVGARADTLSIDAGLGPDDAGAGDLDATPTDRADAAPDRPFADTSSTSERPGITMPDCSVGEGVSAEWVYPSGRRGVICAPLRAPIAVQTEGCRPRLTTAYAAIPGPLYFYLEGDGALFNAVRSTTAGFVVEEAGTECGTSDEGTCRYRRLDRNCEVDITRAGRDGDLVELRLKEPCQLLHDFGDFPTTEITLTAAVVRARLQYVGDAIMPSHDGGALRCDATF